MPALIFTCLRVRVAANVAQSLLRDAIDLNLRARGRFSFSSSASSHDKFIFKLTFRRRLLHRM